MAKGQKKRKEQSNVEAKATAKFEAVAKATYQRKRAITEIIPPDVTRAKAGAWLDLISPITEWAGLKGDQIRQLREQLRIQREDALMQIALCTRQRLDQSADAVKPIPNKFIVPFLEKASLEDKDSELIAIWANLLTSAATNFDPHMVRFSTILSEIGVAEVKFLHKLCREARGARQRLIFVQDVPIQFSSTDLVRRVNNAIDISKELSENFRKIIDELELPGGVILTFGIESAGAEEPFEEFFEEAHDLDDEKWESSISLLQSLGIIENHLFMAGQVGDRSWFAESVSLTSFGVAFVSACDAEIRDAFRDHRRNIQERARQQLDIENWSALRDDSESAERPRKRPRYIR